MPLHLLGVVELRVPAGCQRELSCVSKGTFGRRQVSAYTDSIAIVTLCFCSWGTSLVFDLICDLIPNRQGSGNVVMFSIFSMSFRLFWVTQKSIQCSLPQQELMENPGGIHLSFMDSFMQSSDN